MLSSRDSLYILPNRSACVKHFFIFLFVSCPRWMFVSVSLAATVAYFNRQSRACQASFSLFAKYFQGVSAAVQLREPGGAATEAIRRDRVKSSRVPLAALGVISPWNPLATLSFHQENSAIAEGLVLLRVRILESSELGVLCFGGCPPSILCALWT